MRDRLGIRRNLECEDSAGRCLRKEPRYQRGMVRNPLQSRVGKNHIVRYRRFPGGDISSLPSDRWKSTPCRGQHFAR